MSRYNFSPDLTRIFDLFVLSWDIFFSEPVYDFCLLNWPELQFKARLAEIQQIRFMCKLRRWISRTVTETYIHRYPDFTWNLHTLISRTVPETTWISLTVGSFVFLEWKMKVHPQEHGELGIVRVGPTVV